MATRAALMRLASVDSETIRPFQTAASKSSRLTIRSRLNEELQEVEDLGFDGAQFAVSAQLPPVDVDGTIVE